MAVAAHEFHLTEGSLHVSSSFGVAGYAAIPAPIEGSVDALIAAADGCLYHSKETGRNRVTGKVLGSDGPFLAPGPCL